MRKRECQRCGQVTYWCALDGEPAPCCYAPRKRIEHEDGIDDMDPRDAAWLRGYMRKAIY